MTDLAREVWREMRNGSFFWAAALLAALLGDWSIRAFWQTCERVDGAMERHFSLAVILAICMVIVLFAYAIAATLRH